MIEYTLALALLLLTFIAGIISTRIPLTFLFVLTIDLVMLGSAIADGIVIIGYSYAGGVATPITQTLPWFPLVAVIALMFNGASALMSMVKK